MFNTSTKSFACKHSFELVLDILINAYAALYVIFITNELNVLDKSNVLSVYIKSLASKLMWKSNWKMSDRKIQNCLLTFDDELFICCKNP